jgi:hypothetical protein
MVLLLAWLLLLSGSVACALRAAAQGLVARFKKNFLCGNFDAQISTAY